MDDEEYAQRYSAPYSHNTLRKWTRMGEQMADARFEEGKGGFYVSAGAATKHRVALGGEVGVFGLPTSWSTVRIGAIGLAAEGLPSALVGGVVGGRIHAPTRLSPFVGLSGMVGYAQTTTSAQAGDTDSDGNPVAPGTTIQGPDFVLSAVIPEVGLSYWINSRFRMNLGASYYVTSQGGNQDFLLLGLSLEYAPSDGPTRRTLTPSPELETVFDSDAYFKEEEKRLAPDNTVRIHQLSPIEALDEPAPPPPPLPGIPIVPAITPVKTTDPEPLPSIDAGPDAWFEQ